LIPQRNKIQTPSKQPKISRMTHEENEEMQHDISKLQDQVQQISLSQKITEAKMDGLNKGIEAKINGMKDNIEYWKKDMEGWKEVLTKCYKKGFLMAKR